MQPLVNKAAQKAIVTIDPEDFFPSAGELVWFDMKSFLVSEMLLREKDFREAVKTHDWTQYNEKYCGIGCSNNALIPRWAYMLVAAEITAAGGRAFYCRQNELATHVWLMKIEAMNLKEYEGKRVVVKGCGEKNAGEEIYLTLMSRLQPLARSVNFGEACSMVPLYKRTKE